MVVNTMKNVLNINFGVSYTIVESHKSESNWF